MEGFQKFVTWMAKVLRLVGGTAVAAIMFLTVVDVILRSFGHPIFGSYDIVQFLTVIALGASLAYTHFERGHVGVDILMQKFSPRTQAMVDAITSFVCLILFALCAWQMWLYAGELSTKGEVSMTIQVAKHPFIYGVAVCFGLWCVAILMDVIHYFVKAVKE